MLSVFVIRSGFNSTLVQLKVQIGSVNLISKKSFNSTLVQLKANKT